MKTYLVKYNNEICKPSLEWSDKNWANVESLKIDQYRPEGSQHKPETEVKVCYNDKGIFALYKVKDKYVKAVHNGFQDNVYKDSCVEFFVRPKEDRGYFNFEFNCVGNILAGYKKILSNGDRIKQRLPKEDLALIKIETSLKDEITKEIEEETIWYLSFFIPFSLLEKYVDGFEKIGNSIWRANFYKCGDITSHPHWVSWSPVTEFSFHMPECFGKLIFEKS